MSNPKSLRSTFKVVVCEGEELQRETWEEAAVDDKPSLFLPA